ncbi:UDP-N-acetylmuramate dehydrogenase [Dermatobacter hominis]|uniref:UDP-N-acetylmuramate dehydrogenase n=1 Tax=Dermatobacter hominis TaxID=2884263 RepID=UPI001D1014CF|nr:UDP-N-acetylmuramate dehydrogenase [Dermatobacter hominis]UDY35978.1 UDP-N-acetylmuramate dehydrogenase [Dermatobacter hominis]
MSGEAVWRPDVPIGPLTTYRVGGAARWFLTVHRVEDLLDVARRLEGRAVLVVGKGSNLLVRDAGFDGLVVQLGDAFAGIDVLDGPRSDEDVAGSATVRAGGAAFLPVVARRTVAAGLTGFEWAVGVPGSIGGAVRMNAGGHGSEIAESLVGVRVVDLRTGEDGSVPASDLDLAYRSSNVRDDQVVVHADLRLRPGDVAAGEAELSEIVRWRREHQPGGQNAGSVFTNPEGDSAGRLIDAAGCRGLRIGTAEVSTKHANFIQADAGGSADDVFALMVAVARRVMDEHGVELHPETRMVGFPPFAEAIGAAP